jgi:hypothetical protein
MATVISLADRTGVPRGRKADIDDKLVALLTVENLPLDSAVVLGTKEGIAATPGPGKDRQKVQNRIRSHWKAAGRGPDGLDHPLSIRFNTEGFPQVSVNPAKMES